MHSFTIALALCGLALSPARAESLSQSLELIESASDRICQIVAQKGDKSAWEINAEVKAELSKVLSKLGSAGFDVSGKAKQEQYSGVLQEQLAEVLKQNIECRLRVFERLSEILTRPDSPPPPIPKHVPGWLATFETREHGGGRFAHYPEKTCVVETPGAIDIRKYFPKSMSSGNVLVSMTATTDHQVAQAGEWIYYLDFERAPGTQCVEFEETSDGVRLAGGPLPLATANEKTDTSKKRELGVGVHTFAVRLACYFQAGRFPVVNVKIKPPGGEWRDPRTGDFSFAEPSRPEKPPGADPSQSPCVEPSPL
jgi:hypothetical protein